MANICGKDNDSTTMMEGEDYKFASLSSSDDDLSYWSRLKQQGSTAFDCLSCSQEDVAISSGLSCEAFDKIMPNAFSSSSSSMRPYVAVADLNNSDDAPYENKPKPAIELGIKICF